MELNKGGQGESKAGPRERFVGEVWLDTLADAGQGANVDVLRVHFPPGARTAWHSHPQGQVLHILDGAGLVQSRGGAVERVYAGDTVVVVPGEEHWHGAAPASFMTHIAVQGAAADGRSADWGEHVAGDVG